MSNSTTALAFGVTRDVKLTILGLGSGSIPIGHAFGAGGFACCCPGLRKHIAARPTTSRCASTATGRSIRTSARFGNGVPFLARAASGQCMRVMGPGITTAFGTMSRAGGPHAT